MADLTTWTSWQGEMYAFCSEEHADMFRKSTEDPTAPERNPKIDPAISFGCWWCGEDLTGGVNWL